MRRPRCAGSLALSLALSLAAAARAGGLGGSANAGTAAAQFLQLGADARSAGMGQAMRASVDDANAVYWNPAGLASLQTHDVTFTHGAYYQSVFYDYAAYAQPISALAPDRRDRALRSSDMGAVGVSILYLNAGKLSEVDNTGAPTGGSFTPQDLAVTAAWGLALNDVFDIGLGGKYVSSRIEETAQTGAFDAGARAHFWFGEMPLTIAAGAQNVGGRLRFVQQSDPLPLTLSLGAAVQPVKGWTIEVDAVAPNDGPAYPAVGTEARIPIGGKAEGALRLGYNGRTSAGALDGLTGLTLGGGIEFSHIGFDYGWAPYGVLGDAQRLSFSYKF